jgi:hypothetical protein
MLDKATYKKHFYLISGVSSALIISLAIGLTWLAWEMGLNNALMTENLSTSLINQEVIKQAGTAAPWALMSLNWFVCKETIKKWRAFLKRHL